jgi:trehalose/maltose transport system substrate-binding protein
MWGFVWQGRAYEGLTCDALEWVASNNGGTVVEQDGGVSINNPRAIEAIDAAAGWVDTITPPGVLNYTEEESRGVFQSGNAVFMRNWPYAWSLAQSEESQVRGKLGVTVLPKGGGDGRHVGTLGGWQLSVSKYSKHPELAANLVMFLVSRQEQKRRAVEGSYNPTIATLYQDPEVLAANPFFGELFDTFVNAVPRPSTLTGAKYNKVSKEFWNAVHSVLSGRMSAGESLAKLDSTLRRLRRGGW